MRTRNITVAILAATLITVNGYTQSRNSTATNINIANKTITYTPISVKNKSNKLKFATGWKMDSENKWISNVNAIADIALNSQTQTTVPQNFQWIQFLDLTINNQDLYAILFENSAYISPAKLKKEFTSTSLRIVHMPILSIISMVRMAQIKFSLQISMAICQIAMEFIIKKNSSNRCKHLYRWQAAINTTLL